MNQILGGFLGIAVGAILLIIFYSIKLK